MDKADTEYGSIPRTQADFEALKNLPTAAEYQQANRPYAPPKEKVPGMSELWRHAMHRYSRFQGYAWLGVAGVGLATFAVKKATDVSKAAPEEATSKKYGPWSLDERDKLEVWGYRISLTVVAASFELGAAAALLPESVQDAVWNPLYFAGATGLGVSLALIHMYADVIKKTMQALYAAGLAGSVFLAVTNEGAEPVPRYVLEHPQAVWLVGPMFAAFTALSFKEGACYGKPESAALFFLVPITLLAHLFGAPALISEGGFAASAAALAVLAARKYTQAVKDDVGDKSVFAYLELDEREQEEWDRRAAGGGLRGSADGGGGSEN